MNNANQMNDNLWFYSLDRGHFHTVNFPSATNDTRPVDQVLDANDDDVAVGFYTDAAGDNHGYACDIRRGRFHQVTIYGSASTSIAAATPTACWPRRTAPDPHAHLAGAR